MIPETRQCLARAVASAFGAGPLRIAHVGLPIWLEAMLGGSGVLSAEVGDPLAATGDVVIHRAAIAARPVYARRAAIAQQTWAELNAYAAQTYVPESENSRVRGAGGGSVDDE